MVVPAEYREYKYFQTLRSRLFSKSLISNLALLPLKLVGILLLGDKKKIKKKKYIHGSTQETLCTSARLLVTERV